MKKIIPAFFLFATMAIAFSCSKKNNEIDGQQELIGLWMQQALDYKAYKGTTIIEEYSEQMAAHEEATFQFFENGNFEVYERNLEDGQWVVDHHAKGTFSYNAANKTIKTFSISGDEGAVFTALKKTTSELQLLLTQPPGSNNPAADKETFVYHYRKK